MEKNIEEYEEKNDSKIEKKVYSMPTMTHIGQIDKMTLSGGDTPNADSGAEFWPS